jgi:predicted nuclease of restriction endonuclease-like (RecB) superfamily
MIFNQLTNSIRKTSDTLRSCAGKAINQFLTVRNWLIGFYIVEFEQKGEDRAQYGEKLLESIAEALNENSLSYRNLRLYRQFFLTYPQIAQVIPNFLQKNNLFQIGQSPIAQLQNAEYQDVEILQSLIAESDNANSSIWQSPIAKLQNSEFQEVEIVQSPIAQFNHEEILIEPQRLLSELSYTHLVQLFPIKDRLKRAFYEIECINGCWSVRELQRQIETLYYERCGMSLSPEKLVERIRNNAETTDIQDIIKSPFTFEFLGLKAKDVVEESDIETALLNQIQDFLLELGYGFCFEARQKRILIDGEYYFCDLVFYHRILKCHVLIDLKNKKFKHENISQLNTYVGYYKDNMRRTGDNNPIGILLCTDKSDELVRYATAGLDNKLFVSQYLIELPKDEEWKRFVEQLKR